MPRTQSPLTLVMPLKSPEDASVLEKEILALEQLPPDRNPIRVALNKIETVHFARFVFLDTFKTKIAVITVYDGEFEDYINDFIDSIGGVFDRILSHVADAPATPVKENRRAFIEYVRTHDLKSLSPIYSAYPEASVMRLKAVLAKAEPVV